MCKWDKNELIATEEKYFTLEESTGKITGYSEEGPKEVVIPRKIKGVRVKEIGEEAFYGKELKSVTIPIGVEKIGLRAFAYNEIREIRIPEGMKQIGGSSFYGNKLTKVRIAESVIEIGGGAFNNNQLAESEAYIYVRKGDGSEDKREIISYGGERRENISIPAGVTRIGEWTFASNQVRSVNIPESVKEIGEYAFYNNQITNILLPKSITRIENHAFYKNPIEKVTIPKSVMELGERAFNGGDQLKSVKIIGKRTTHEFTRWGESIWGWASGYNDSNITWNASA